MYRNLDAAKIIATAQRLEQRIGGRFPGSGLSKVCAEVVEVTEQAPDTARRIAAPNVFLRTSTVVLAAGVMATVMATLYWLLPKGGAQSWAEFVQGFDAALDAFVILGGGLLFLVTVETRRKRKLALAAIHDLRALAHVIDMHQLTKDPERILHEGPVTAASPTVALTPFELARYLDYCSEMLSILSKVAALYAQTFADPVALAAIDEIENLTNGLSRKIWQKMMILAAAAQR